MLYEPEPLLQWSHTGYSRHFCNAATAQVNWNRLRHQTTLNGRHLHPVSTDVLMKAEASAVRSRWLFCHSMFPMPIKSQGRIRRFRTNHAGWSPKKGQRVQTLRCYLTELQGGLLSILWPVVLDSVSESPESRQQDSRIKPSVFAVVLLSTSRGWPDIQHKELPSDSPWFGRSTRHESWGRDQVSPYRTIQDNSGRTQGTNQRSSHSASAGAVEQMAQQMCCCHDSHVFPPTLGQL
jgi:hypothetical protein